MNPLTNSPARREIAKAFSWLMADKIVTLGGSLVVGVALARYLGPSDYGTLNYVLAWATLLSPFSSLGLANILTKEFVTEPEAEGRILGTTFFLSTAGSVLATVFMAGYLGIFPPARAGVAGLVLLVVGATCLSSLGCLEYWFIAKRQTAALAKSRMTATAVFMILRVAMMIAGAHLFAFLIVSAIEVVSIAARNYVTYRLVRRERRRWSWDFATAKKLLSQSWPLIIGGFSSIVYLKLDVVMLSHYRSAAEVGTFSVAARLSEILYFMPVLFMSAAFPPLLDLRTRDPARYRERLQDLTDALVAAGTLIAVAWSVGAQFIVPLLFGDVYAGAVPILMIHTWAGVFIFARAVLSKWIVAEGLFVFSLITQTCGALCNVVLNVILIPRLGGIGAAWATLISYAVASYFSLLLSRKSLPAFYTISRSFLWPVRAVSVAKQWYALAKPKAGRS